MMDVDDMLESDAALLLSAASSAAHAQAAAAAAAAAVVEPPAPRGPPSVEVVCNGLRVSCGVVGWDC